MTHYQDPADLQYQKPACGARPLWSGGTWNEPDSPQITCRECQQIAAKEGL